MVCCSGCMTSLQHMGMRRSPEARGGTHTCMTSAVQSQLICTTTQVLSPLTFVYFQWGWQQNLEPCHAKFAYHFIAWMPDFGPHCSQCTKQFFETRFYKTDQENFCRYTFVSPSLRSTTAFSYTLVTVTLSALYTNIVPCKTAHLYKASAFVHTISNSINFGGYLNLTIQPMQNNYFNIKH